LLALVLDGVLEGCHDRLEQDAVLEVLLGARDDGEVDLDARLHRVEVVRRAAALRVGRARVRVLVKGLFDAHRDLGDLGASGEVDRAHAALLVLDEVLVPNDRGHLHGPAQRDVRAADGGWLPGYRWLVARVEHVEVAVEIEVDQLEARDPPRFLRARAEEARLRIQPAITVADWGGRANVGGLRKLLLAKVDALGRRGVRHRHVHQAVAVHVGHVKRQDRASDVGCQLADLHPPCRGVVAASLAILTAEENESLALVGGIGDLPAGNYDVEVAVVVHVGDLDVLGRDGRHLLGRRACALPVVDRRRIRGRRQDDLEAHLVGEQNVRAAVAVDVGQGDVGRTSRGQRFIERERGALVGRR